MVFIAIFNNISAMRDYEAGNVTIEIPDYQSIIDRSISRSVAREINSF
jgi:hypothetical protein